jgi:hypothetical protein
MTRRMGPKLSSRQIPSFGSGSSTSDRGIRRVSRSIAPWSSSSSLLEAYRTAQGLAAEWWQDKLDRAAPPATRSLATRTLNHLLLGYIDTAAAEVRDSYELERRALESSPDGRRAHLIRKLLAGELDDIGAAARTLNHPLEGRHVALVLWRTDDAGPESTLSDTLTSIATAFGSVRCLTTSARERSTLSVFLASGSSPSRAAERLGVHRNTVAYRLNALEDVLASGSADGDWTTQASRRLELELALRIVDQLGPLPLPTQG